MYLRLARVSSLWTENVVELDTDVWNTTTFWDWWVMQNYLFS